MGLQDMESRQGDGYAGPSGPPERECSEVGRGRNPCWLSSKRCFLLSMLSLVLLLDSVQARQWYESSVTANNMSVAVYETFHQTGHACVHDSHMVPRINEIHKRRHKSQAIRYA
jgi:hypothetical protein